MKNLSLSVLWQCARHLVVGIALGSASLLAQEARDPTQAPAEAGVAGGAGAGISAPQYPWGSDGMTVVWRDAKPFLVVGTRLYSPGQKVGQYKVERITETEVWLRDGAVVRKLPRFSGIVRSVSATAPAAAASAPKVKPAKKIKEGLAP